MAIDWLLAQANANIDALRREVDIRKQPTGGIYCDQAGGAVVPISTNYLAQGGTQSFSLGWVGKTVANASTDLGTLFGSGRGVSSFNPGSAGIAAANASGTLFARAEINVSTVLQMPSGVSSRTAFRSAVLTFDASTKQAEFFVDGVSVGTEDWSTATLDSPHPLKIIQSTASLGSVDVSRSPSGYTTSVAAWTKALTATEVAEWSASGGKIMPISARANCASHITCDDGAGYQLRDRSGNGNHALLTTSGFTHLIPADGSPLAADGVNASSATYLLRSGPVLPSSAIVTGVIVDGEYLPATGAQSSAQTRIRLNPTGGDLEVQRSDGSTHTPIATFTPASLASVDVKVISQSAS